MYRVFQTKQDDQIVELDEFCMYLTESEETFPTLFRMPFLLVYSFENSATQRVWTHNFFTRFISLVALPVLWTLLVIYAIVFGLLTLLCMMTVEIMIALVKLGYKTSLWTFFYVVKS